MKEGNGKSEPELSAEQKAFIERWAALSTAIGVYVAAVLGSELPIADGETDEMAATLLHRVTSEIDRVPFERKNMIVAHALYVKAGELGAHAQHLARLVESVTESSKTPP